MTLLAAMGFVFLLGLGTAISPCPLTTNIAAISFLSRNVGDTRRVMLAALLYTLGRTLVYVVLGVALLWAFRAMAGEQDALDQFASPMSRAFQRYGKLVLGPALLLVGLVLLNLLEINLSLSVGGTRLQDRIARGGAIWALPLGSLFALAFCPPSIAMFLSALGISLKHGSLILPPIIYGIGTAVPVIGFAFVIAFGGQYLGKSFNSLAKVEMWFRRTTGIVFLLAGIYYILKNIYGVSIIPGI